MYTMFGIVAIGDSIVLGRGDNEGGGWVTRLKRFWEPKDFYNVVYNLGVPGQTSVDLLKRFDAECTSRIYYLRKSDKHVIIMGIGINDSRSHHTSEEDFTKNIQKLIEQAKKHTKNVVLLGLTPVDEKLAKNYEGTTFTNERIKKFNQIIKSVSAKNQVFFVEIFDTLIELDYVHLLSDGLHPNAQGYDVLFQLIKDFFLNHKLLE